MLKERFFKIIILFIFFVIINSDFFKINITTMDVYEDTVLVSYLKEKNTSIFNELEKIKLNCKCLIIYEIGVTQSLRFKIYEFGNKSEYDYISSSILMGFKNIIQSENLSYTQKLDSVLMLFQRVLNQDKIYIKPSDKNYVKELIQVSLQNSQLQSFRLDYLKNRYHDIANFNVSIYENKYPSYQLSIIFNFSLLIITLFYLKKR